MEMLYSTVYTKMYKLIIFKLINFKLLTLLFIIKKGINLHMNEQKYDDGC